MKNPTDRIVELDGLRGLACLFVLIHHYFTGVLTIELKGLWWVIDQLSSMFFLSGVDLFFVLSGFLVGGIILDKSDCKNFLKVFYIRRACRIFPIYFVLILTFLFGLIFLKEQSFFKLWLLEKPIEIWPYFVFLQSYFLGLTNFSGPKWSAITWSVSVEEQFYMIMPFIVTLLGRKRGFVAVVIGILLASLLRMYLFDYVGFYAGYMLFPARMDTILWGVLVAYVLRSEKWRVEARKHYDLIAVIAVGMVAVLAGEKLGFFAIVGGLRYTMIAAFYAFFIYAIVDGRLKLLAQLLRHRFLVFTGAISYAMYMFHQLINGLMHGFIYNDKPLIDGPERLVVTTISVLIVYAVCYLSLKYFEHPIRAWGASFYYTRQGQSTLIKSVS